MAVVSPGTGRAPAVTVPLSYLVTAAAAFVLAAFGTVWLAAELTGHYYHPRLFALTHTVTLGWITLTIVGASYQLVPILLERPFWSERLGRVVYVALVIGFVGMIAHFLLAEWSGLAWAAGLVAVAAGAHVVNVALTIRNLRAWTFTARLIAVGHAGLALTALSGVLLGADKAWKFLPGGTLANLHAHVHLALLGWVLPMVIGVAARVYPMFLLAPEPKGIGGTVQLTGLLVGVPTVVFGILLQLDAPVRLGALAVAAAIGAHLAWIVTMVRTRKRPALDWSLRSLVAGAALLAPATAMGLALAFDLVSGPRAAMVYAVLAFGGWASLTIVGMMLKIVPFLVWYHVFGPRVGKTPVPTLAELSSPRAEAVASVALTAGAIALVIATGAGNATAVRAAGAVVTVGALGFATALGRTLAHFALRAPTPAGARFPVERAS